MLGAISPYVSSCSISTPDMYRLLSQLKWDDFEMGEKKEDAMAGDLGDRKAVESEDTVEDDEDDFDLPDAL